MTEPNRDETRAKRHAASNAYTKLLADHPDLRPRALAMIEDGKTREEIVAALGAGAASAGWAKAVDKVNAGMPPSATLHRARAE